jgi:UDP-glucose 4-epimerase
MTRRILITGGAGFVGANLVRRLEGAGHEVWIYDDLSRGSSQYLPSPERLVQGDIRDRESLIRSMKGMDTVIHLAAFGSVVESVSDPLPNFSINVSGTQAVLDSACSANVSKLIFASTGGALIGDATPPVDENSLPKPISPYGASKLCGEAYCHAYAKAFGLQTVCLRFANVYGPYSAHKKGAVTKFMKCLFTDEPMPIFGDGSASRDFLHVDDLCEGIALALDADVEPGDVFHLASGEETTIQGLARTIADIAGKPEHPIHFHPQRQAEVSRNFARYDKAHRELGFEPGKSLRQGLEEAWRWYSSHSDHVLSQEESDS